MSWLLPLQLLPQWVVWRYESREGEKPTKVPYQLNGYGASSTDPKTWTTYENAVAYSKANPSFGIGFVLSASDPWAVIDLDVEEGKTLSEDQINCYKAANSYTEWSPSGRGLHVWLKAYVPPVKRKDIGFEIYSHSRYFTVTGNVLNPTSIEDRQSFVEQTFKWLGGTSTNGYHPPVLPDQVEFLNDQEIIKRAAQAANGDKFAALWENNGWESYLTGRQEDKSHSAADLALCNMLAFYTDNKNQVYRLWMQSPLGKTSKHAGDSAWGIKHIVNKAFDRKIPDIDLPTQIALTTQYRENIQAPTKPSPVPWTQPPGLIGQIASFILNDAYSPLKEVALAGAIAYFAGLVGRAYDIGGLSLNQYLCVLAPTGSGKEGAKTAITKLNKAVQMMLPHNYNIYDHLGPESINSAQGLYKKIAKHPCCVSLLSEFGLLLQDICDRKANENKRNIRSALLKLYSSKHVGTNAYADDAKNGTVIDNPAYSIFGESTQFNFYKAINEQTITEGFLPRLTLLEYNGPVPVPNEAKKPDPDASLALAISQLYQQTVMNEIKHEIIKVAYNDESEAYRIKLSTHWRLKTDHHNSNGEDHLAELCTRMMQKIIRLAALSAVGINSLTPVITMPDILWAENIVMHGFNMIKARFDSGQVGEASEESKQYQLMEDEIDVYFKMPWSAKWGKTYRITELMHSCGVISYHYLDAKLRVRSAFRHSHNPKMAMDNALNRLVDSGVLAKVSDTDAVRATSVGGVATGRMWRRV